MTAHRDDEFDSYIESPPPGPDGYLVIALRFPNAEEWDGNFADGLGLDHVPPPAEHGTPEWSMDHLARFHGWDELAVRRFKATTRSLRSAHDMEHEDYEKTHETSMLIPHTHPDDEFVLWAMGQAQWKEEPDRRAMMRVWRHLPDC